jgi:hypothetical protein
MGIRENIERLERAAQMPHRNHAGDNRLDARLSSQLGRLYFSGDITEAEYEAGIRYAGIVLKYLQSIDSPAPYGGELSNIEDDGCLRMKINFSAAHSVLKRAGKGCTRFVDKVAVYDEPLSGNDNLGLEALRRGLRSLAGA